MVITIETEDNLNYWYVETTKSLTNILVVKNIYNKEALIEKLNFDKSYNDGEIVKLNALNADIDIVLNQLS